MNNKLFLDDLRTLLKTPEHLATAYKLAKGLLLEHYGDEFARLDEQQQALAVGHVMADLLEL